MAGFDVVLGLDYHKPSLQTFMANHPKASTILGDIRQVSGEQLWSLVGERSPRVMVAGVPCQGFSLNNRKRHADDQRNFLFLEFVRMVRLLRPDFLVLENVSGMRSTGDVVGEIERQIVTVGQETGKGYRVEHRLLNAADFGVPQLRKRLIFLAWAEGYEAGWPEPSFGPGLRPYRTVRDAIGDLPSLLPGESSDAYLSQPLNDYQEEMRQGSSRLMNHTAPNLSESFLKRIAATEPGCPMYSHFRQRIRLSFDKPSPTQVAGGIRPQVQFGHPADLRGLTIRERARIQSFPDRYVFTGGIVQGRVQTGNAVPPLLARAIARQIRKAIEMRPFRANPVAV